MNPSLTETFSDRLITLSTGAQGLRGSLTTTITKPDLQTLGLAAGSPAPPILDFIASDDTLDRYEEVIDAKGWKLDNYRKNPVFQNSHQYGDIIFTLGKSLITEVRDAKLFQRIEFAIDINPMARICYGLYSNGFLNAVSVGFIPIRWENAPDHAPYRRKYLEQELLELSSVAVPANPAALILGLKSGAVAASDIKEVSNLLNHYLKSLSAPSDQSAPSDSSDHLSRLLAAGQFCKSPAGSDSHARVSGIGTHDTHLLQLARELTIVASRA
jgi:HK97 family phage prohead protease